MNIFARLFLFAFVFINLLSCKEKPEDLTLISADNSLMRYAGRVDLSDPKAPVLIGSASYVEMRFKGDSSVVLLTNLSGPYNFVCFEVDHEYIGRVQISGDSASSFTIKTKEKKDSHLLRIIKATESQNDYVVFNGVKCFGLDTLASLPERKIEFIGNSITCGMGVDTTEIACGTGQWFDQHNAYYAYGPRVGRELNAQFMLSSVSGIGIYRNWNSEFEEEPAMPDVYESLYLRLDKEGKWDFSGYSPDLVSICLGTNDMSEGDGTKARQPFDSAMFISKYIKLVDIVKSHYPEAQICLLNSPMKSGGEDELLCACLDRVKQHFIQSDPDNKEIKIFYFAGITPHGCDYHPDKEDHRLMAGQLMPFYKEVMQW